MYGDNSIAHYLIIAYIMKNCKHNYNHLINMTFWRQVDSYLVALPCKRHRHLALMLSGEIALLYGGGNGGVDFFTL